MDGSEKLKISSDYLYLKTVLFIILFCLLLVISDYHRTEKGFPSEEVAGSIGIIVMLFFLFTRPSIYYNDDAMFIIKNKVEIEVPLENIRSIKYSVIGNGSWLVKYWNEDGAAKSVRIFSSIISNPCSVFIKKVKLKNSSLVVRYSSIGINELFDI